MSLVTAPAGTFKGEQVSEKVTAFKGIPFAKPPVGELRWKKPVKPDPIEGVFDATKFGYTQVQTVGVVPEASQYAQSEDCLTLNIWTRGKTNEKKPVIVWIHGGGFYNGGTADPLFNGQNFVEHNDVVFVTVNYRLGFFGFFDLEPFGGEEYKDSCNAGIYDCIAGLEWVKENIEAFGGDPENITAMGESAGGSIVSFLTVSPLAKGLFRRGVCMSGTMTWGFIDKTKENAEAVTRKVAKKIGCETMEQLMAMTTDQWRDCIDTIMELYGPFYGMIFTPTADGIVIPKNPGAALKAGAAKDIDLLMGYCRDEMKYLSLYDPDFYSHMEGSVEGAYLLTGDFPDNYDEVKAELLSRPGLDPIDMRWDLLNGIMTHQMTDAICDIQSGFHDTYKFVWSWNSNVEGFGACHATDIAFVFDNLNTTFGQAFTGPNAPEELALMWGEALAAFAKTGKPAIKGVADWPKYDVQTRGAVAVSLEPEVVYDPRKSAREILSKLHYWAGK